MHKLRRRLSPSTLIATAALFVALGGTAIAAGEIITSPDQLADRVVTTPAIASQAVTAVQIANSTITTFDLAPRAVTKDDLANPTLAAKVNADGSENSPGAEVRKTSAGKYEVTFAGRSLERCAVVATIHDDNPNDPDSVEVSGPTQSRLDTVTVTTHHPRVITRLDGSTYYIANFASDSAFDLIASC